MRVLWHYFTMKIPNKRELQQMSSNHLSDFEFKDFMKFYKDYTKESFSFLVNNAALPWDSVLRFRTYYKITPVKTSKQ